MKSVLSLINMSAKDQCPRFFCCLLLGIALQGISLLQPQLSGDLLNSIQNGENYAPIAWTLVFLLVLNAMLSISQQATLGKASEKVVRSLRNTLTERIFSLPVLTYEQRTSGWYSQRLLSDPELVRYSPEEMIRTVQACIMLTASLFALIRLDAATLLVGLLLGLIALSFAAAASKPIETVTESVQECAASITSQMESAFLANRILRSYNAWASEKDALNGQVTKVYQLGLRKIRTASLFSPIASALMQVANVGTILFGAIQVARGILSFTDLIVFLMYFSFFSSAISQIVSSIQDLREAEAGSKRIIECLSWCEENRSPNLTSQDGPRPQPSQVSAMVSPCIRFEHVSFTYPGIKAATLHDVSFSVPSGKTTALVGASGGGKTTCLGLVERFFPPSEGTITLDRTDLSHIDVDALRSTIGYIDQGAMTVHGSLRANLLLAKSDASEDEVKEALQLAGLEEYRDNLDYYVGENGLTLSGGQKQRLALARTILKAPRLLLMDEPTANLDGISEQDYFALFRRCFPNATILYSAHRESLIMSADWIVVIKDGTVLGEGEHDDLMENCAYYRELIGALQR